MKLNVGIEGGWSHGNNNATTLRIRVIDPVSGVEVAEVELSEQQVLTVLRNGGRSRTADGTFELREMNVPRIGKHRVLATVKIPAPYGQSNEQTMTIVNTIGQQLPGEGWFKNEDKYNHHKHTNGIYTVTYVSYLHTSVTREDLLTATDIGYEVDYYVCKKEYDTE